MYLKVISTGCVRWSGGPISRCYLVFNSLGYEAAVPREQLLCGTKGNHPPMSRHYIGTSSAT